MHNDWLTELYFYGCVKMKIDMKNAVPAFTNFPKENTKPVSNRETVDGQDER